MRAPAIAIVFVIAFSRLIPLAWADADGGFVVHVQDQAMAGEVRGVLQQAARQYPLSLEFVREATLVDTYDVVKLRHDAGTPQEVAGAYASQALVGSHVDFMSFGPYATLQPGHYLIIFRLQGMGPMEGKDVCALDVGQDSGHTITQVHPDAEDIENGKWLAIPVEAVFAKRTENVEYRFWAHGRSFALDRIYVLRLGGGSIPAGDAGRSSSSGSGAVEIAVPAAPLSLNSSTTQTAMVPGDPNVIERPEFQNKPKALVKSLTSITSMMVSISADGEAMGCTSDIIATVDPASRQSKQAGVGFVRSDGDKEMATALEEAVRAVKLRYPLWEPGHIDLSFGEKFVAHGGPSAGAAFAVLMLATLEGFDVDPKCAVTGDITVDWRVRQVGAVTAKLRGATLDKCLYAAIPADNEAAFADMALLYGNSALWDIQVFSISTLQQAVALIRRDRSSPLTEAMMLFAGLQSQLAKAEQPTLLSPETRKTLTRILELAPNHLSAKYLLAISEGHAAKTLSLNGTWYRLSVIFYPYRQILNNRNHVDRDTLPVATTIAARKRLAALRPIAHKSLMPLVADTAGVIEAMDGLAGKTASSASLNARIDSFNARLTTLQTDLSFIETMVREGY